jgi:hypothetical protein
VIWFQRLVVSRGVANLRSFAWYLSEPEQLIALDGSLPGGIGIRLLTDLVL